MEIDSYHLALVKAKYYISLTSHQSQGSLLTQLACLYAVLYSRGTTALDMAQYGYTHVHLSLFLDVLADIDTAAYTLCYYNQGITTAILIGLHQVSAYIIQIKLPLRNQNNLCTTCNTCQGSQPAATASHNLYYSNTAVSRSSITQLVDSINNGVGCSITANGVVSTPYIIINSARQADDWHTGLCTELAGTAQAAVTTDDNQALNAALLHVFISFHTSFRSHETLATSCTEESTATLEDICHTAGSQLLHLLIQKAAVSIIDTPNLAALIQNSTHYCTSCCIHARAVATTC